MSLVTTHGGTLRPAARSRAVARSLTGVADARRVLQVALGLVWLLDAALQFQPYMFSRAFVTRTLGAAAQGNPPLVAQPVHWALGLLSAQPVLCNAGFAGIQLLIALGLFWRRTVKAALVASIVWSAGVWWLGEGLGGVLNGASPYSGAPGAVIIYALLALLLWPNENRPAGSVAAGGALGPTGARAAWMLLWGATAYLLVRLPNSTPGMARDMTASAASGQPGWLASFDHHLANLFSGAGFETAIILGGAAQVVALSTLVPRLVKGGIVLAVGLAGLLWLMQGLGGVFTGVGTDPNSGPMLALVAISFWPRPAAEATSDADRPEVASGRRRRGRGAPPVGSGPSEPGGPDDPGSRRPAGRPDRRWVGPGLLGALAALSVIGTVSSAAEAAGHSPSDGPPPSMAGMKMAGMGMAGMGMAGTATAGNQALPNMNDRKGPSAAARMICAQETRHNIARALGLAADPRPSSSWADHLFTCTYRLPEGVLVLSVKELSSDSSAQGYLEDMTRASGVATPLTGLASLGLPGYSTPGGAVMFRKDDKTLQVNAVGLPRRVGTLHLSRNDLAYQIATDILACWSGH